MSKNNKENKKQAKKKQVPLELLAYLLKVSDKKYIAKQVKQRLEDIDEYGEEEGET